jgi:hypothetical protein
MTRIRRILACHLKNGLTFSVLLGLTLLTGCFSNDFQSCSKEADISANIKKICWEEYKLNVVPKRAGNTLWVYAPQESLLHLEAGKSPEFEESIIDKLRSLLSSISRVCLSSDKSPEFFVLVLSDINLGLDYSLTANLMDVKKANVGVLPWTEANKRYVVGFDLAPKAVGDITGVHLQLNEVKMPDFLSRQIVQRLKAFFLEEPVKKYFTLTEANGGFVDKRFVLAYSAKQISEPKKKINIGEEVLNTITYCFKTYEFNDFEGVVIRDLQKKTERVYEKKDILSRSIE